MVFNDDDPIHLPPPPDSGPKPIVPGRVQLVITNNPKAPLEQNIQTLMLELTGGEKSRSGLDLVAVLDVSGSMQGDKIQQLKTAMLFVLKKLDLVDRLSIVKYFNKAKRLCRLRQMTKSAQPELEDLIKGLEAGGNTNITDGLQTALDILKDRNFSKGRVGVIMLMSDGEQNRGGDAAEVQVGDVPVHTFGFGDGQDAKVLKAIADNSRLGGTYSDVRMANLNLAFSQCLGGLLSVVAMDLTVTVTPVDKESAIKMVSAGRYPQIPDNDDGSITIRFGDLYINEGRKTKKKTKIASMGENRGSIAFFSTYRPSVPLDIFSCPVPPLSKEDELNLTDGVSYNYNCQVIPPVALKTIIKRLKLTSEATEVDVNSGCITGFIFVSERENNLKVLHIALRFNGNPPKVKVFSLADVYGTDLFGGVRMEDGGCIGGGYEVGNQTIDHFLIYVSTKEPVQDRRCPWTVVYKTNLRTGETERLTPAGIFDLSPSVSPSGKKIAVASFQGKSWDGEIEDLQTEIYVMNVEKSHSGLGRKRVIVC